MAEKQRRDQKKSLPEDAEEYIAMAREKASPSGRIMQRVQAANAQRLDAMTTELEVANVENALKAVKGITPAQTQTVVAQIFKDKSAEEIKEILQNMTPETIQRLQMLQKATDPVFAAMQPPPQPTQAQSGNDLLLQYLLKKADEKPAPAPQPQGITMADVVAIVRLVNETKTPAPTQNAQGQGGLLETIKTVNEIQKPWIEKDTKNSKELLELKLKEIKDNQPPDLVEQVKYIKDMTGALGLGNSRSEIDLKLEEMRENREIDMKRLDWEQKKYEMEVEADATKWEQIGRILQGPVGDVIKNVGAAGADRVRGARPANPSGARVPKAVQTQCPNCGEVIYVDAEADTAVCGKCGATLQKAGGGSPPPAPAPTRVDAPPPAPPSAPAAVAVAPSAEDGEGNEESEDDGHSEESEQTEQQ